MDNELINFVLEIDSMTTMEFCKTFKYDPPKWRGNVELAAIEFAYIDAMKWNKVREKAKELILP